MASSVQIEEVAAAWLAKRDSGQWRDADQTALTLWLQASTAHRVAFVRLEAAWHGAQRLRALGAGSTPGEVPPPGHWRLSPSFENTSGPCANDATVERIPEARGEHRATGVFGRPAQYRALAASVVLMVALGTGWYVWPRGPIYRTPIGGLASVPMPDGSKVTLNTNSEIRVAVTETERRVTLDKGEAFFEVAKDPRRPFVVHAGDKQIVAVGTKFSVRRDADAVRVVVTEGRVRLERSSASGAAPLAQLSAGTIARAAGAGTLVQEKPLDEAEEFLSWRTGFLVFRDTTLGDAVAEFNRYNMHKIVIEDPAVAAMHVGGSFRSTNVDAFVRLLQEGFQIHVDQRDEQIVLTRQIPSPTEMAR